MTTESEGYETAVFRWTNRNGYSYTIEEEDDGIYLVCYEEDGEEPKRSFTFNDLDADGLISMFQSFVQYCRGHRE